MRANHAKRYRAPAVIAVAAIGLAGCGSSGATPPTENPLLTNGVSKIHLYEWIHKANQHLDKNIRGHSRMCVRYEVGRARARALPDKARQKIEAQLDKKSKAT